MQLFGAGASSPHHCFNCFVPSWTQTFASRSFSSCTSASRRATLAFTAASSEMPRDGKSAAKSAAEDDRTAGSPERRCIQRFSREPGWRGSCVTSAPSGRSASSRGLGRARWQACFTPLPADNRLLRTPPSGSKGIPERVIFLVGERAALDRLAEQHGAGLRIEHRPLW